jgi:hypothetical protein
MTNLERIFKNLAGLLTDVRYHHVHALHVQFFGFLGNNNIGLVQKIRISVSWLNM